MGAARRAGKMAGRSETPFALLLGSAMRGGEQTHQVKPRMPKITYISNAGKETTIDVSVGMSVMRAAIAQGIDGIDADCGGSCACATCHVYVDAAWADKLKAPAAAEADMLDFVIERKPESRLSCQLEVTAEMDGLVVRLPVAQH